MRPSAYRAAQPNSNPDPDILPSEMKIGTPVVHVLGNVHINFGFPALFIFRSYDPYVTDGWTDRQTDGRAKPVLRLIRSFFYFTVTWRVLILLCQKLLLQYRLTHIA